MASEQIDIPTCEKGTETDVTSSILDAEQINFARILLLTAEKGTQIFRKALTKLTFTKCNVETIKEVLNVVYTCKEKLSPTATVDKLWPLGQWRLHLREDEINTVEQLDMDSCNTLLNIQEISDFTYGKYETLKRVLERLRKYRNDLCQFTTQRYSNEKFDQQFEFTTSLFNEIAKVYPELKISDDDILKYKTLPITMEAYIGMKRQIQDVLWYISALREDLELQQNQKMNKATERFQRQLVTPSLADQRQTIMEYSIQITKLAAIHRSMVNTIIAMEGGSLDDKKRMRWEELKKSITNHEQLKKQSSVLSSMAGESEILAKEIQDFLDQMILNALRDGKSVWMIILIHLECLKKMQSTLIPEYIVVDHINAEKDLKRLAESSNSIAWIYLDADKEYKGYWFTEKTISLLTRIFDQNKRPCSIYIGEYNQISLSLMIRTLQILKEHKNANYKYLIMCPIFRSRSDRFDYMRKTKGVERVFQTMVGMKNILTLCLECLDLPWTVLKTIGTIVNDNANTLFDLGFSYCDEMKGRFHLFAEEVRTRDDMVLSNLSLSSCLHPTDAKAVAVFLAKLKYITTLYLHNCECEISQSVLQLKSLTGISIESNEKHATGEGLNVIAIVSNLHKLENLERLIASHCGLNDSVINLIPLETHPKMKHIELCGNEISDEGKEKLKQKCEALGITCKLSLF